MFLNVHSTHICNASSEFAGELLRLPDRLFFHHIQAYLRVVCTISTNFLVYRFRLSHHYSPRNTHTLHVSELVKQVRIDVNALHMKSFDFRKIFIKSFTFEHLHNIVCAFESIFVCVRLNWTEF